MWRSREKTLASFSWVTPKTIFTFVLKRGEFIDIPLGMTHSIENPGDEILEIIEVQMGDYLGEDDIVRFDDVYGRVEKS